MADFIITYGDESEVPPVFVVTPECGHTYRSVRQSPDHTPEMVARMVSHEKCPDCLLAGLDASFDEVDYRLSPDTEALGWSRLNDALTVEETIMDESDGQGVEDPDEKTSC